VATAATAGVPVVTSFSAAPSQPRSAAIAAFASSTSAAAPLTCAARARKRSATTAEAERNASSWDDRSGTSMTRIVVSTRMRGAGRIAGAAATPGTTGMPCSATDSALSCRYLIMGCLLHAIVSECVPAYSVRVIVIQTTQIS